MKFYLRIEGVNLNNFVYETSNLSTIRGGGLLLLDAVTYVQDKIREKLGLVVEPISTGASSGLFAIDTDEATAKELSEKVESYLNDDSKYRQATFVVDVLPATSEFTKDRERLIALNRWRQMTSPQVAVPTPNNDKTVEACELDLLRPAKFKRKIKGKVKTISDSVRQRRKYGLGNKDSFVKKEVEKLGEEEFKKIGNCSVTKKFAWDFDDLTKDKSKGNLHHKMAVIYLDGNDFGKIQRSLSKDDLADFDGEIKKKRRKWLASLITRLNTQPDWIVEITDDETDEEPSTTQAQSTKVKREAYRIEILTWGGDEVCLVVPAWKGWETVSHFFNDSKTWVWREDRLFHAVGIVFCHHNAPIRRVKKLAEDLANQAKIVRTQNLFAYEILESFDHIGRGLEEYRKERCPQPTVDDKSLILSGENMGEAINLMKQVKDEAIPRRKLIKLAQLLLRNRDATNDLEKMQSEEDEIMQEILKQAKQENKHNIEKIISCVGGNADWWLNQFKPLSKSASEEEKQTHAENRKQADLTWWVHLNALWDYID
jgi:hypothetical protein